MYLCEKCLNVFEGDYIKSYLNLYGINSDLLCPIRGCVGTLNEIDENIIETISILNRKGYTTKESCSGHLSGECSRIYIEFAEIYLLSNIPSDFKTDFYYEEDKIIIQKTICGISDTHRQAELWNTAQDLLFWAESLPVAKTDNEMKKDKIEKTYTYTSVKSVF